MDLANYVSFSGRIGRHQYWFHYVFPLYIAEFVAGLRRWRVSEARQPLRTRRW